MERGQLGIENRPATVFVFDNLIAKLDHPQAEKFALRLHRWDLAVDAWTFQIPVCNYIEALIWRFKTPVEVITWRPQGFARALSDRLWERGLSVREVQSGDYVYFSPRFATDAEVTCVFDPDPAHLWGYGFKARPFDIGRF
jgi:hypothetical protein